MKQYDFVSDVDENGKESISVAFAPKRKKIDVVPMIICFFIALLIWIYMINLNDTGMTATMTIPVTIEGVDELRANENMMIYGVDKTDVVITVKGSNRDLKKYTKADYRASVNVSDIDESGRHSLPINIIVPDGSTVTVDIASPAAITLYTDISETKVVPFDYIRGNWITNPSYEYSIEKSTDYIEITGPKMILDTIEGAKFRLPDERYDNSRSFSGFQLSFNDKNGDYISYDNSAITYSTSSVFVKVNVTAQKMIPVVVRVLGAGSNLVAKPSSKVVFIKGDPLLLSQVEEYSINLLEASVGSTIEKTITSDDLPEGVTVENEGSSITITFEKATN